jgi:hypothetical protein
MAKLTSKTSLVVDTNIVINEPARTIQLLEANGLTFKEGVTLQAVYSKLVDLWATSSYQDSPFPMYAIDALSGQFQIGTDGANANGWTWADTNTRNALRDGGWSEFTGTSGAGTEVAQYCGFIGLGSITPTTTVQPYYHLAATDSPINFPFTDQFNIGIKVKDNVSLDKRTYAKAFVREYGKKFKSSILADTGSSGTGAFKQNFLVSNEDDLKLTTLLGSVAATADSAMSGAPYSGITVGYYTANQSRTIAGVSRNFKIIINGNNGTLEQIYAKVQYMLRQGTDINTGGTAGSKIGKIQDELLKFVGDTLVTSQSVYIDNVLPADSNRVEFYDDSNTLRVNNYTAAGTLEFNSVLVGAGSSYRLMYTAPADGGTATDYGSAGAITVNNAAGTPITGTISAGVINFDFDWNGNTQGGYTGSTARPVTLIAIRPGYGKFAAGTGTITQSKSIKISATAEADRVYSAA